MYDANYVSDAVFIHGDLLGGLVHGTYPATLFSSALGRHFPKGAEIPRKIVVYWPDDWSYPLMSQIQAEPNSPNPNGGAKVDADYPEVGTFGIYVNRNLKAWYDFDHWPGDKVDGVFHLAAGLADGHYHVAGQTHAQISCDGRERRLYVAVAMRVRTLGNG